MHQVRLEYSNSDHGPNTQPEYTFDGSATIFIPQLSHTPIEVVSFGALVRRDGIASLRLRVATTARAIKQKKKWALVPNDQHDLAPEATIDLVILRGHGHPVIAPVQRDLFFADLNNHIAESSAEVLLDWRNIISGIVNHDAYAKAAPKVVLPELTLDQKADNEARAVNYRLMRGGDR